MTIDTELLQEILEDLYDLKGEWKWKEDEPRCGYQKSYQSLCDRIAKIQEMLKP